MNSPPPAAKSLSHQIVNAAASIGILAGCVYGYTLLGERQRPARSKPPRSAATIVTSQAITAHDGPVEIAANGVVVPLREIRLATEVAGRVVRQSANLRTGRMVDRDEILIELDRTEYDLEVQRLQAQAGQESAELASTEVGIENTRQLLELARQQLAIAQGERDRVDALVKRSAASGAEVDIARRGELTSRAALVQLENQRRDLVAQRQLVVEKQSLTKVALRRAELDLSRTILRSPLRGRVVVSAVEEQSYLPAGTTFVTIEDTSAVEVRANLTSDQMVWVWSSAAATAAADMTSLSTDPSASKPSASNPSVTNADTTKADSAAVDSPTMDPADDRIPALPATIASSFGGRTARWNAVLERIDGAGIDLQTRTYPCLFRVESPEASVGDDAGQRLLRGMFVSVTVHATPDRQLFEVSESAIRPGNRLWLHVDGKLHITPVAIVSRRGDGVIVEMLPGDAPAAGPSMAQARVVTSPISDPVEGMALVSGQAPTNPPAKAAG